MLIDFSVTNFRSFYTTKTLSLTAQSINELKENVITSQKRKTLKSVAIYGANSSGKSNLIQAMLTMQACLLQSVKLNPGDKLYYDPFLLTPNSSKEPTRFEITFIHNNTYYRYGFEYTLTDIINEWLFTKTSRKVQYLFIRTPQGIDYDDSRFPDGIGMETKVNSNRLFLSLCAQLGGRIANEVMEWFQFKFNIIAGLNNIQYRAFSLNSLHHATSITNDIKSFLHNMKLGFNDVKTKETPNSNKETSMDFINSIMSARNIQLLSIHNIYDELGLPVDSYEFDFAARESAGTNKLFDLSGPIFVTLHNGGVFIIDELDAKMHPLISLQLIMLFHNKKTNPLGAQLIFSTHDTHLLSTKIMRRDQIWFTEKDIREQSDLYCLMDFVLPDGTKPRNDSNYERNYIAGRYGAIPYLINE